MDATKLIQPATDDAEWRDLAQRLANLDDSIGRARPAALPGLLARRDRVQLEMLTHLAKLAARSPT